MSKLTFIAVPEYGDVMTLEEFDDAVDRGLFIDYDGSGHFAGKLGMESSLDVYPSDRVRSKTAPEWATHIVWFNK